MTWNDISSLASSTQPRLLPPANLMWSVSYILIALFCNLLFSFLSFNSISAPVDIKIFWCSFFLLFFFFFGFSSSCCLLQIHNTHWNCTLLVLYAYLSSFLLYRYRKFAWTAFSSLCLNIRFVSISCFVSVWSLFISCFVSFWNWFRNCIMRFGFLLFRSDAQKGRIFFLYLG